MMFENGMPASAIPGTWTKSAASNGTGNCVEVNPLPGGGMAVRNSRFPDGPALVFTGAEMTAFFMGAAAGEFEKLGASSA